VYNMQKIVFINANGQSIILGRAKPYLLLSIAGTGAAETDVQMQKAPFQDGQTYIDTLLEPRIVSIEVAILASTQEELHQKRREIAQVFNPKLGPGTLRYEYDGGVREIEATSDLAPVFPTGEGNQAQGFQRALISLICPSPFWLDTETQDEYIGIGGGLSFPMQFPLKFANASTNTVFTNEGDVECPVLIVVKGPAQDVTITNETTGEHITINAALLAGEKLEINTEFGNKYAELVKADGSRENVLHYISLDSTFWQLQPGDNIISLSGNVDESAELYVYWKHRYVGV